MLLKFDHANQSREQNMHNSIFNVCICNVTKLLVFRCKKKNALNFDMKIDIIIKVLIKKASSCIIITQSELKYKHLPSMFC